jgi:hypothetical protein
MKQLDLQVIQQARVDCGRAACVVLHCPGDLWLGTAWPCGGELSYLSCARQILL